MKAKVIIELDAEGFHFYPDAPQSVSFLQHSHRHTFKIICGFNVTDLNREKEIFLLRDELKDYLGEAYGVPCQFGAMSCEMIAQDIINFFLEEEIAFCEVWEENTGGARIEL